MGDKKRNRRIETLSHSYRLDDLTLGDLVRALSRFGSSEMSDEAHEAFARALVSQMLAHQLGAIGRGQAG